MTQRKLSRWVPLEERLWSRVHKEPGGCWLWTGGFTRRGYGQIRVNGRNTYVHRVTWSLAGRSLPEGMEIDHLCRVHNCVNPDHLEPVTHRENVLRGTGLSANHARKTRCIHGHPLDGLRIGLRAGARYCITCNREKARQQRIAQRASA